MENQTRMIKEINQEEMQRILDTQLPSAKALLDIPGVEGFAVMIVTRDHGLKSSIHAPLEASLQIICMMEKYQESCAHMIKKYVEKGGKT